MNGPRMGVFPVATSMETKRYVCRSETDLYRRSSHMRVLLGFAAFATTTLVSPAQAQSFGTAAFTPPSPGRWVMAPLHDGDRHGRKAVRVHRGLAGSYGYAGYNDYSDFDGNRSFDPN